MHITGKWKLHDTKKIPPQSNLFCIMLPYLQRCSVVSTEPLGIPLKNTPCRQRKHKIPVSHRKTTFTSFHSFSFAQMSSVSVYATRHTLNV